MADFPLIDLIESRAARDAALALVDVAPWSDRALALIPKVVRLSEPLTSEKLRHRLLGAGLEPPPHPNAWGALTMRAVKRGLLEDTGLQGQMSDARSHARRTPIWRRV